MPARGGIRSKNLAPSLRDVVDRLALAKGVQAMGVLRLAANVADTETVTIGSDTYEIETCATASGATTGTFGDLNNTNNPQVVRTAGAHGMLAGDPFAVGTEICQVIRVIDATTLFVARGRYGTTNAAHGNAVALNKGNGITAGNIPVGFIATFTPAVAGPALAAAINNALAGPERIRDKAPNNFPFINAVSLVSGAEVMVYSVAAEVRTTALTETLAGVNNAWNAAAMKGGVAPSSLGVQRASRAPDANEVTLGFMRFRFPFAVAAADAWILITATGVRKVWDGGTLVAGNVVTLDNTGATDWAATDTAIVVGYE